MEDKTKGHMSSAAEESVGGSCTLQEPRNATGWSRRARTYQRPGDKGCPYEYLHRTTGMAGSQSQQRPRQCKVDSAAELGMSTLEHPRRRSKPILSACLSRHKVVNAPIFPSQSPVWTLLSLADIGHTSLNCFFVFISI